MELNKVTMDDGKHCAALINALGVARFSDVSGKDLEAIVAAKLWLRGLALQMAASLKAGAVSPTASAPAPQEGFKIKGMGPISSGPTPSKRKKKK